METIGARRCNGAGYDLGGRSGTKMWLAKSAQRAMCAMRQAMNAVTRF